MQFLHELAEKAVHMKNIRFNMKRAYKIRRDLTEQVEVGEGVTLTFKRGEAKYLKQIENLHLELSDNLSIHGQFGYTALEQKSL